MGRYGKLSLEWNEHRANRHAALRRAYKRRAHKATRRTARAILRVVTPE